MALKKSQNVVSSQRENYQNGVPGLFLEFLIMFTVPLILVSLSLGPESHFDALLSTVTNNECFNVALKEFLTKERENFLAVRTIIAKKSI